MHIDFFLWGICFVALWVSHFLGKTQGRVETNIIWESTLKKIVSETEDEFKSEYLKRMIEKLRTEVESLKNETLSE